ncbi:hypothetical protein L7F22_047775 [Adiantum nelumboides]|nr:hypothetical protein [Adiantum nelumboides]
MDTLGALVLATKPPIDDILLRLLVGKKEPFVSFIGGYGHIQEALELANLMQRHGISLNVVTYLCGLKACTNLEGKGSKTRASMKCTGCQGSGMKVSIRQLGLGMIQQMQHGCPDCKGSRETISEKDKCTQCKGEKVVQDEKMLEVHVEKDMQHNQKITILGEADEAPDIVTRDIVCVLQLKERAKFKRKGDDIFVEKDKCTQCKGEKVVQDKKMLEVHVEKGMQHNQKITILGEADEVPDTVTGDIVCVLQLKEHAKFKRKGDDIFVEHTLNLKEAPCGFQFVIVHLDGRKLLIKPAPGEIVKPESGSLSTDQCKALEAILPLKPLSEMTNMELGECDKTILQNVNLEKEMKRKQQHQ